MKERKKERKKRKNPRLTLTYQERYSAVAPQYNQQTKGRSVQQTSHVNRETCNVYNDYYPLIDSTKTDTLLPTGKRYTPWNFALRFLLSHCRSLGDLFRLSTTVLVSLISRSVSRSVFLQISIYCWYVHLKWTPFFFTKRFYKYDAKYLVKQHLDRHKKPKKGEHIFR